MTGSGSEADPSGPRAPRRTCRLHVLGASGAGTTTLGRALADALAIPHHDTDDYYWMPSDPPYRDVRPPEARMTLMEEMFIPGGGWVLSGSLIDWGDGLHPASGLEDHGLRVSTVTPVHPDPVAAEKALASLGITCPVREGDPRLLVRITRPDGVEVEVG